LCPDSGILRLFFLAAKQSALLAEHGIIPVHCALPFAVDTWEHDQGYKPQFLTHAHRDHALGIAEFGRNIYCTRATKDLICIKYAALQSKTVHFTLLELGEPLEVGATLESPSFTFTAFDADHCEGAVMLLFVGDFGNIFQTGDCRLNASHLAALLRCIPPKALRQRPGPGNIDVLYLDCTFANLATVRHRGLPRLDSLRHFTGPPKPLAN
jgi:Cft2 family RNA processing exonuclease